ncbi:MAG: gluconate 2-dehydrogenase subunit 3 family protein [Sphingobacteriales bacterium]|nr:gluconate 2-dehydrogenase subunit 3 family protein [Sphingobacteriales bacterium]MBI3719410.1 gluconate 2-dehydrogenase subunit 3 family protein [Sphingobacteriales bacterium]
MERRELLKMIALATGGALVGGELFFSGCKSTGGPVTFTPETIAFLDEVAETIIPATSTPGAKAAQVGEFMKVYVTDCYDADDQKAFLEGVNKLDEACNKMHGHDYLKATPEHRKELLVSLDKEAKTVQDQRKKAYDDFVKAERAKGNILPIMDFKNPVASHYFTLMKQLTLLGFFTSKTGATETLRHIQVPGKYDGALPYKKGDKAWADSI